MARSYYAQAAKLNPKNVRALYGLILVSPLYWIRVVLRCLPKSQVPLFSDLITHGVQPEMPFAKEEGMREARRVGVQSAGPTSRRQRGQTFDNANDRRTHGQPADRRFEELAFN